MHIFSATHVLASFWAWEYYTALYYAWGCFQQPNHWQKPQKCEVGVKTLALRPQKGLLFMVWELKQGRQGVALFNLTCEYPCRMNLFFFFNHLVHVQERWWLLLDEWVLIWGLQIKFSEQTNLQILNLWMTRIHTVSVWMQRYLFIEYLAVHYSQYSSQS